jgi:hypothetical protein
MEVPLTICDVCGQTFKSIGMLNRHKNKKIPCVKTEKLPTPILITNNDKMPDYANMKIDRVVNFCNTFKPEGVDMDLVYKAANYKGTGDDLTTEVYAGIERRIIPAIYGDPNNPQNHTILMVGDIIMCNGLNGWLCTDQIDEVMLQIREKVIVPMVAKIVERNIMMNNLESIRSIRNAK